MEPAPTAALTPADPITAAFHALADPGYPQRASGEAMQQLQHEGYFHLAVAKAQRSEALCQRFAGRPPRKLWLSANLNGFTPRLPGWEVGLLPKGCFQKADAAAREALRAQLAGSVVIVNNNDVGQGAPLYGELYGQCRETLFVGWDWDNHHWLENSTFLAAHSDLYAPAHHENLYLVTRYNAATAGPVYCASVQWERDFLAARLPQMLTVQRSDAPLGKHIPYGPFALRNRIVATLSAHYPSIGFSDRGFHARTPDDKLAEWTAHKSHWIVPVLNDVPIRIFDALVTGGIPIVPESLRHLNPVREIDRRHIVFYGPLDVIDPRRVVAEATRLFDEGGADGIAARHRYALDAHHGDTRVREMLAALGEQFGFAV